MKENIDILNVNTGRESFVLQYEAEENEIYIQYECKGINARFKCDITAEEIRDFYRAFDTAYDIMAGKETVTVMDNHGGINRCTLEVKLDEKGDCFITGSFKNKDDHYKSGIKFEFFVDRTFVTEMIISMDKYLYAVN